jgi:hypothetical protein
MQLQKDDFPSLETDRKAAFACFALEIMAKL